MTVVDAAMSGAAQASERQLPAVFGRYLLLKRLSRGGMGEIFLAKLGEIEGFEKLVIIKKILPNLVADEEFIKRFIDEAQVAIKLQHANIAPVFEVGKVDGEYFLAIEYIEGRDLRKMIARQREQGTRLPSDLCLFIARELASGLAYAHRRTDGEGRPLALVHCDISPPNVMVSFEGEVKVIDFGIAKSAIRISASNPNMGFGKFGYMAPEQLIRGGIVDKRTDIYAAGVVLYELLTGERLFLFPEGADYRQIARMVTQGKIIPPSERDPRLDAGLDPVVMKALATRQEDRYQSAEELRDAIQMKLAQLNPTISADALAHYTRELFKDEITDEHKLVASMKAIDVAPFLDELTAATVEHTVTFARSGILQRVMGKSPSGLYRQIPTAEQVLAHPRRRKLFFVGGTAAMVAGGALAMLFARMGGSSRNGTSASGSQASTSATPKQAPTPVPTPTPTPPPAFPTLDVPPMVMSSPHHHSDPSRHDPRKHRAVAHEPREEAAPKAGHSPAAVQNKFHTVKTEYLAFKKQYGGVLEDRWNQIASEIAFGKADKYDKVDAMLDSLRKEMKAKEGGE